MDETGSAFGTEDLELHERQNSAADSGRRLLRRPTPAETERIARYGDRSTIITSQLPPAQWHDYLADATLADAICDRILHNAHRLVLKGPSRRKEAKLDD